MLNKKPGFTIVELVLSVGLFLILAGVAFWAINPLEKVRQIRDKERFEELGIVRDAVDAAISAGSSLGSTYGIPSSTVGVEVNLKSDGSGWVPVDLSSRLSSLPNDPRGGKTFTDVLGSKVLGEYQFVSDGKYYILRTHLEAEINRSKYVEDGNDNTWYEIGSAPGLSTYFGL